MPKLCSLLAAQENLRLLFEVNDMIAKTGGGFLSSMRLLIDEEGNPLTDDIPLAIENAVTENGLADRDPDDEKDRCLFERELDLIRNHAESGVYDEHEIELLEARAAKVVACLGTLPNFVFVEDDEEDREPITLEELDLARHLHRGGNMH